MSQKFKKIQNKNDESTAYGKWFATAVYDQHFIETERIVVGQTVNKKGQITQKYLITKSLVKDVVFEETYDTSLAPESTPSGGGNGNG